MKKRQYNKCVKQLGISDSRRYGDDVLSDIQRKLDLNKEYFLNLSYESLYNKVKDIESLKIYLESHERIVAMREESVV